MEYSPEAGESILRDRTQFNLPNQTRWQKCSSYRNPKLRAPAPNLLYSYAFYVGGAGVASLEPGANPHCEHPLCERTELWSDQSHRQQEVQEAASGLLLLIRPSSG